MGPHGLVIGATGSGKSEFLRTLVLGLAMTHSPEQLNMVLVDFKGGATFAGMSEMPHVSAVITNLAQELTLVDRMQDALSGEMVRRQELLREAGNFASIRDYEKARAAGEDLAPMPSLFIVVDEFSEMLAAKPEFIDLFVAIGRLGRSLGLHLLLASPAARGGPAARPGVAPVLPGRPAHLLAPPSRARCSAYPTPTSCPPVPGLGLPQARPVDAAAVQGGLRLRAAVRAGARTPRRGRPPARASCRSRSPRCRRSTPPSAEVAPSPRRRASQGEQESLLDVAVARMVGQGPAAHQVWLPPLDVPDTLDELMPDLVEDPRARPGLAAVAPARRAGRPARHRRPAARAAPRHADAST